jgi:hypothetical protein
MLVLSGNTNIITTSTIPIGYYGDVTLYALWKKTDTSVSLINVADIIQKTDAFQINGRGSYYDSVGEEMLRSMPDGFIIGSSTYVNEICYTGLDALYSDGELHYYSSTNPSPVPSNRYFESTDHLVFCWVVKQGSSIEMMVYFPESEYIQNAPLNALQLISMVYHE